MVGQTNQCAYLCGPRAIRHDGGGSLFHRRERHHVLYILYIPYALTLTEALESFADWIQAHTHAERSEARNGQNEQDEQDEQ